MKEEVTLNKKEQKRFMVLNKIESGELTAIEGSQLTVVHSDGIAITP
jgi:hypothetical protein